MDIFISGSKDGITMVEGCGMEFPEDRLFNNKKCEALAVNSFD